MKQNSIKIIKSRISALKLKKFKYDYYYLKSLNNNNIELRLKNLLKNYYNLKTNKDSFKKVCTLNGKYKSINKKLKLSRTSINYFIINNNLFFYKN